MPSWGSNSQPLNWQPASLPTELLAYMWERAGLSYEEFKYYNMKSSNIYKIKTPKNLSSNGKKIVDFVRNTLHPLQKTIKHLGRNNGNYFWFKYNYWKQSWTHIVTRRKHSLLAVSSFAIVTFSESRMLPMRQNTYASWKYSKRV